MDSVVLGFRPHTYWTAVVALAGPAEAPQVVERRKIVFAEEMERFIFHQAADGDRGAAQALIDANLKTTTKHASLALEPMITALKAQDLSVDCAVVPAANPNVPWDLDEILKTHSRIHSAEGNHYREAVAAACARQGLKVRRIGERDIPLRLGLKLAMDPHALEARMKQMGVALGPPWSVDQRLAAQAAWLWLYDDDG